MRVAGKILILLELGADMQVCEEEPERGLLLFSQVREGKPARADGCNGWG